MRRTHVREINGKRVIVHKHPMSISKKVVYENNNLNHMKRKVLNTNKSNKIHKVEFYPLDYDATNRLLREYKSRYGSENAELVWASPKSFLSVVASPDGEQVTAAKYLEDKKKADEIFKKYTMKGIESRMENSMPLDPLILYKGAYLGCGYHHEGRHRAYVAYRQGIKEVPIILINYSKFKEGN